MRRVGSCSAFHSPRCRPVFIAAIIAVAMPVIAARQTGSLFGIITDINGEPAPGVRVVLTGQGQPAREAITNPLGRYTIDSLPPGKYRIEAHVAGFEKKVSAIAIAPAEVADWSGALLVAPLLGEVPIEARVVAHTAWDARDCGRRPANAERSQLEKSLACIVESAQQRRPAAVIVQYTAGKRGGYGLMTGGDGVIEHFQFGYARLDFQLQRCDSARVAPDARGAFVFACD